MATTNSGTSPCFPNAQTMWEPHQWASTAVRPRLPKDVTHALLMRVCSPVRLHVVQPEARHFVQSTAAWFKYVKARPRGINGSRESNHSQVLGCVAGLRAFRPRICSLQNVNVWGEKRRIFNDSTYFIPPGAAADQRAHDVAMNRTGAQTCSKKAKSPYGPTKGHVVITRVRRAVGSQPRRVCGLNGLRATLTCMFAQARHMVCVWTERATSIPRMHVRTARHMVCVWAERSHRVSGLQVPPPCCCEQNLMGVAYYHTLYETLGSIAFLLDYLRAADGATTTTATTITITTTTSISNLLYH